MDQTTDDIEKRYKTLTARRDMLNTSKLRIDAELASRKSRLRETMEECKKAGFDPSTLEADIKRTKEVLAVKMNMFEADLQTAEDQIKPMLKELGQ